MLGCKLKIVDCTLRDGGYYCNWDFPRDLVNEYLAAMAAIAVDYVELGFRSLNRKGFRGAYAYTTDDFLESLAIPKNLKVGVMINASELVNSQYGPVEVCKKLFNTASKSQVKLVRIACHVDEFDSMSPVCAWLNKAGYIVGINLMQVAARTEPELVDIAKLANNLEIDVLYFADSLGSLDPHRTTGIVRVLKQYWLGDLGIHAHDNMGNALANTLQALDEGLTWADSTVTGMGRGPGNTKTEFLATEVELLRMQQINLTPLLTLIRQYFAPMQYKYGWGTNAYYYLAGKYSIHPTYIQEMMGDSRYSEEDILAAIDHLRIEGGKKFCTTNLDSARHFYQSVPSGGWNPAMLFKGQEVLLLGAGPGVEAHRDALERYVRKSKPIVVALNTQSQIDAELIDVRVACHPLRLLADCEAHSRLPQPLITPVSMLPTNIRLALGARELLDFGLGVKQGVFEFAETHCILPSSLVIAYALAVASSGKASRVLLAGFDGYGADDPRRTEADKIFHAYQDAKNTVPLLAITPTLYSLETTSVYALT